MCSQDHLRCQTASNNIANTKWAPTRLIDVGHEGSEVPARLVVTAETISDGPKIRYSSLSHKWGTTSVVTLTRRNLEKFKHALPLNALSQTFRDSILLTRALGLQYIWIDSLCIVQDDDDDWVKESAVMGDVYKQSHFNIAAMAAAEGNNGLFIQSRDRTLALPVTVHVKWKNHSKLYYCGKLDFWSEIENAELNRRAWVLQERYLSPRTVYFGSEQLFWECRQHQACESLPKGLQEGTITCKAWFDKSEKQQVPYTWWWKMVRTYTKCALTQENDKLVALSGMAKEMRQCCGDKYLAGHWRNDLVHSLLWSGGTGRPQDYRGTCNSESLPYQH